MLVLTRRPGQEIIIDGKTVIYICDVKGDRVRIGIEAPREVVILRREVAERIEEQKKLDGSVQSS